MAAAEAANRARCCMIESAHGLQTSTASLGKPCSGNTISVLQHDEQKPCLHALREAMDLEMMRLGQRYRVRVKDNASDIARNGTCTDACG